LAREIDGEWKDVKEQAANEKGMTINKPKVPKPIKMCINVAHHYKTHKGSICCI
jgi:hypothetical protein